MPMRMKLWEGNASTRWVNACKAVSDTLASHHNTQRAEIDAASSRSICSSKEARGRKRLPLSVVRFVTSWRRSSPPRIETLWLALCKTKCCSRKSAKRCKQRLVKGKGCGPADPTQSLPRPSGPEPRKSPKRDSRGRRPQHPRQCARNLKRVRKMSFRTFLGLKLAAGCKSWEAPQALNNPLSENPEKTAGPTSNSLYNVSSRGVKDQFTWTLAHFRLWDALLSHSQILSKLFSGSFRVLGPKGPRDFAWGQGHCKWRGPFKTLTSLN